MVIRRASPVKNRIQQFGGNALAVIFDGDRKTAFPGGSHQVNGPVGAGMEQGIFQKVIDNLFYQGCIHGYYDDGLAGFEYAKPSELSGGMRQRAALIRTLALKPDLLLLDEPFSALDYQTRLSVCDDISSIIRQTHKTAILVTHDLSEAISVADRILVLSPRPGRVKKILSIDFPENCTRSLDRRNCPEFSTYFNMVWKELKTYE